MAVYPSYYSEQNDTLSSMLFGGKQYICLKSGRAVSIATDSAGEGERMGCHFIQFYKMHSVLFRHGWHQGELEDTQTRQGWRCHSSSFLPTAHPPRVRPCLDRGGLSGDGRNTVPGSLLKRNNCLRKSAWRRAPLSWGAGGGAYHALSRRWHRWN